MYSMNILLTMNILLAKKKRCRSYMYMVYKWNKIIIEVIEDLLWQTVTKNAAHSYSYSYSWQVITQFALIASGCNPFEADTFRKMDLEK